MRFLMQLLGVTRMLEQKLAEAKSKKDTLKARAKSASASKQITEMIQGLNTSNALTAFDKMEEKVMALEAESESTLQVGRVCVCGAPPQHQQATASAVVTHEPYHCLASASRLSGLSCHNCLLQYHAWTLQLLL